MEMFNLTNLSIQISDEYNDCTFTNQILLRYMGITIFFVGIISTILSICVFTRKPLRHKSCCFYFLILAISDSINLTTMTIEHFPYSFNIDVMILHSAICKIIIFMIYFSNHLSNIVLTLASIDRFILIYYPTQSKLFCNIPKARRLVLIVMLVLLLSNGHILYGYRKISTDIDEYHHIYSCYIDADNIFYKNIFHFYDTYIESICFILIPFIIMSVCSTLIIVQIIKSRRKNRRFQQEGLRDKDIQLCCMLIGTSITFLLLCLPTEINDILSYLDRTRSCFHWFRKVLFMLLQQIYYAGHFYIYTLTGQIFRTQLYAILFQWSKKSSKLNVKNNQNHCRKQLLIKNENHEHLPISESEAIHWC